MDYENEEAFVKSLVEKTGENQSLIGDDCAVLRTTDPPLLLTTDTMNYGVHYTDEFTPSQIAEKLARINISDIAAMGGDPTLALLNASGNRSPDEFDQFMDSLLGTLEESGITLAGGDTSRVNNAGSETFSLTMIGHAHGDRVMERSQARPGERIGLTGPLGGTGAVLSRESTELTPQDLNQLAEPPIRIKEGQRLVSAGIRCGIDLSDGFLKDLNRICSASGVGARVDAGSIQPHPLAREYAGDNDQLLKWVLAGGEDFELLVTVPEEVDESELPDLRIVGSITEEEAVRFDPPLPESLELTELGYDHFTSTP